MLWRVRATLADRPGALAALAESCGDRGVNILGLQIFPGFGGVTDELVLRAPRQRSRLEVARLVEEAGGRDVVVTACTEHALGDGPTRYLHAVRSAALDPSSTPHLLARLLDAEPGPAVPGHDGLEVSAGGRRVMLRRTTPFTPTEHARAAAFVESVAALVERVPSGPATVRAGGSAPRLGGGLVVRDAVPGDALGLVLLHDRCTPETLARRYGPAPARVDLDAARALVGSGIGAVVAAQDGVAVGLATLGDVVDGACEVHLLVEDGRQRQGIGSRLLGAAVRRAGAAGADDLVLRSRAEDSLDPGSGALVGLVFGAGLAARVRLAGGEQVVTVATRRGAPTGPEGVPTGR